MSALLLVQTFISVEVLFTMTIVGGLALAAALLTGDAAQRRGLIQKLPVLALPYLIAGLAASWYLLQVLGGATYAQGVGARYPTDLLAFVVPMPYTWLGGSAVTGISNRFWGGLAETTSYLGLPLVLIMGRYLWTRRHTQKAMILGILTILLGLWILGPALYVDGNAVMRLPYQLLGGLPVFSSVLEGRVSVFLALVASVILASWLASPRRRRALGWACALVAVIFVMPNLINPSSHDVSSWTNPTFFRTAMYRRYLGRGTTVLPINWGATGESFMWQAEDHFYWNMANGYWMFPPPPGWRNHLTADLWWHPGTPRRGDGQLLKQMIIERHVSDVVVQDDSVAHWQNVITTAGLGHGERVGGITLYRVPEAWLTDART